MRNLTSALLAFGGLLSACDAYIDSGPVDYGPPVYGPACTAGTYSCNGLTLEYCAGDAIELNPCDAVCRSEGFDRAASCGYDPGVGGDTCFCEDVGPLPAACPLAAPSCSGPYSVDSCDPSGAVVTWDCDALCQGQGYALSEGCGYDAPSGEDVCLCASGPTGPAVSCLPSDVQCLDGGTIETCGFDGYPIATDCDVICRDEGFSYSAGCGYDAGSRGDACFCQ